MLFFIWTDVSLHAFKHSLVNGPNWYIYFRTTKSWKSVFAQTSQEANKYTFHHRVDSQLHMIYDLRLLLISLNLLRFLHVLVYCVILFLWALSFIDLHGGCCEMQTICKAMVIFP